MKIPKQIVEEVEAKTVRVNAKVCDSGSYTLLDADGKAIADRDDYVPSFFPGQHYGDYLELDIDIETGQITNWKKPEPKEVAQAFGILPKEE